MNVIQAAPKASHAPPQPRHALALIVCDDRFGVWVDRQRSRDDLESLLADRPVLAADRAHEHHEARMYVPLRLGGRVPPVHPRVHLVLETPRRAWRAVDE